VRQESDMGWGGGLTKEFDAVVSGGELLLLVDAAGLLQLHLQRLGLSLRLHLHICRKGILQQRHQE